MECVKYYFFIIKQGENFDILFVTVCITTSKLFASTKKSFWGLIFSWTTKLLLSANQKFFNFAALLKKMTTQAFIHALLQTGLGRI